MQTQTASSAAAVAPKKMRRKLAESQAILDSAEQKRLKKPILVTGVRFAATVSVIQPSDFDKLHIDDAYQRVRISDLVNTLVSVLLAGGQIPDPVDIAQRPDGSWWIVDGQQRFWASSEAGKPIKAHIHIVDDLDSEVKLFYALNSRRGLAPKVVLKGWPGPAGVLVRHLNESDKSPLKGMIDVANNTTRPIDGALLVKAMLVALTGLKWVSGDTAMSVLPRLDSALRLPGMHAWAEGYVQLVAAVLGPSSGKGGRRVRYLPMLALAYVAHEKYTAAGRVVFPHSTSRLRAVNWDTATPSHAMQYLPMLINRVERLWK